MYLQFLNEIFLTMYLYIITYNNNKFVLFIATVANTDLSTSVSDRRATREVKRFSGRYRLSSVGS